MASLERCQDCEETLAAATSLGSNRDFQQKTADVEVLDHGSCGVV